MRSPCEMMRRLYHLTCLDLAVDAARHDMLESAYDRSARDMALQGMGSDDIRALLEETFHHRTYEDREGIPFFSWFEDHFLVWSSKPSLQPDNTYLFDETARDYLVRFTVDVEGSFQRFDGAFRPTILHPDERKDDPFADQSYIGIPSLGLDHVVHIHASPRAQGALRAAILRYGSEHVRRVPIDIIHYRDCTLFEVNLFSS